MLLRITLLFLFIICVTSSPAQKKMWPLEGSVQAGLLEGEQGTAFQVGVTGGVKSGTWTTSIGTGLDYYGIRSIPLYLQVNKNIFNRSQTPFVYLGSGYHFPWMNNSYKDFWGETKTAGGLYYSGGIGYQLPAMKKAALYFAAGYSYKQYQEDVTQSSFCIGPGPGPCPTYKEKFTHRLRRLSITTGLRF